MPSTVEAAAARRLAQTVLAASKPSRAWTPLLEEAVRAFLRPAALTSSLVSGAIDPHLLPHPRLASGLFHWAFLQPGFSHSPHSFHSLLRSLSPRHARSVSSLLGLARKQKVALLPSSYHLAISSFLFSDRPVDAFGLIDRAGALPPALCNSLLAGLSSNGSPALARKVLDGMLERGIEPSDLGFGVFIRWVCVYEGLEAVLSIVDDIKGRQFRRINGSIVAVLIVDGFCRSGKIEEARRALQELRLREWKPDFVAYRIVSEAFRAAGREEECGWILKQKRKLGVAPRVCDYKAFILSLISERRFREAKELGEAIISGDFPIEDDVLNALIESISTVDPGSAVTFVRYLTRKGRVPTFSALAKLSKNLSRNGSAAEICDVYSILMSNGYFVGAEQYNMVVSFLCEAGKLREAYDVLKEMRKKGVRPDISSYNCLMEACCRQDMMRPAKKLWDEMFTNGCPPDLRTYNVLVGKLSEVGDAEEVVRLHHNMLAKGVSPDQTTYAALVKVLCKATRLDAAVEVLKKSWEQDATLAGSILSALVGSICSEGNFDAACSILRGLPSAFQDSHLRAILLKSLIDAGKYELANEHVARVRRNSPLKIKEITKELMASLSTASKPGPLLQFLRGMEVHGLKSWDLGWMVSLQG